jgi:hypothetical protein
MTDFFIGAEKAAKSTGPSTKTLLELIDEIHQDKKLSMAPHWDDGNKIRDGILKRAPDEGELLLGLREVFLMFSSN